MKQVSRLGTLHRYPHGTSLPRPCPLPEVNQRLRWRWKHLRTLKEGGYTVSKVSFRGWGGSQSRRCGSPSVVPGEKKDSNRPFSHPPQRADDRKVGGRGGSSTGPVSGCARWYDRPAPNSDVRVGVAPHPTLPAPRTGLFGTVRPFPSLEGRKRDRGWCHCPNQSISTQTGEQATRGW